MTGHPIHPATPPATDPHDETGMQLITNHDELRERGFSALVSSLGWANAVRFIRLHEGSLARGSTPLPEYRRRGNGGGVPESQE